MSDKKDNEYNEPCQCDFCKELDVKLYDFNGYKICEDCLLIEVGACGEYK